MLLETFRIKRNAIDYTGEDLVGLLTQVSREVEIVGRIAKPETFATGGAIRELKRLQRAYGKGKWRKRKGIADVRLEDGSIRRAEIHWYEATGLGRKELKIKCFLY